MKYKNLNQKKGVAGLNVLLSIISMLFMIGIIIMVFVIAGSKLRTSIATTESYSVSQTGVTLNDGGTSLTTCAGAIDGAVSTIDVVYNATVTLTSANYTHSGCYVYASATSEYNNTGALTVNYTYTTSGTAGHAINNTYQSIDDTVDWFPTFIVLGAMVVLILLVVIIINSIRSSGITKGA